MTSKTTQTKGNLYRKKIMTSIVAASVVAVVIGAGFPLLSTFAENDVPPTEGYDIHITVNDHDSANLQEAQNHYCKLDANIVAVCQLYDTTESDAQLTQIEFIITRDQYLTLPLRERASWHNHAVELTPERGSPDCVSLPEGLECGALVAILQTTFGKVITIWDPADGLPNYPPYVYPVDSPFALLQDLNDDLELIHPRGDESTSSAEILPNCGIAQAGPCGEDGNNGDNGNNGNNGNNGDDDGDD